MPWDSYWKKQTKSCCEFQKEARSILKVLHSWIKERKSIYIGLYQSAQAWITQFYLQIFHACLFFISAHQMAPPLTEVKDIQLQFTTHLSTPKGWKAELAWLVDGGNCRLWEEVFYRWTKSMAWVGFSAAFMCLFVCLSVCLSVFPHDISKTDAARIIKLDKEMFHHESWKPIYFGVKRLGQKAQKYCWRGSWRFIGCWGFFSLSLALSMGKGNFRPPTESTPLNRSPKNLS